MKNGRSKAGSFAEGAPSSSKEQARYSTHPWVPPFGPCIQHTFTKTDWISFEHDVLYHGLDPKGEVSHMDVANNAIQ